MTPTLDNDGDVWILNLGDGENRFTPDWMAAVADALDEVAAKPEPRALVTTANGKIWSNGIAPDRPRPPQRQDLVERDRPRLARPAPGSDPGVRRPDPRALREVPRRAAADGCCDPGS